MSDQSCAGAMCGHDETASASWVRPPRERYVRTTLNVAGCTFEPGIEWRDGDDFELMAMKLEETVVNMAMFIPSHRSMMDRATYLGDRIAYYWPDRAYFVEVWEGDGRGWCQVYQPWAAKP